MYATLNILEEEQDRNIILFYFKKLFLKREATSFRAVWETCHLSWKEASYLSSRNAGT